MRRALGWLVVTGAVLLGGCGYQGLSFFVDERVDITSPGDQAEVALPVTVEWTIEDFSVTGPTDSDDGGAGYFGVLVDRAPPPPGRTLESLVENDQLCQLTEGCPDEQFLADRDIYSTSDTSITIERLADLGFGGRSEFHEVTIVLLNGRGERIGESAFRVEFELDRTAT